jgi:voltage-gated potassium channel Kch
MVRLVDGLLRYGKYLAFAAVLIFGATAFLFDSCVLANGGGASWEWPGLRRLADAFYRAAQLFVLEFNRDCNNPAQSAEINLALEAARYAALVFSAAAVVAFFAPRLARRLLLRIQILGHRRRAIVLGYGPVGQAIAHELATRVRHRPAARSHADGLRHRLGQWMLGLPVVAQVDQWWRQGRFVTAIHSEITPALAETARRDNVVLVEGDPSDPALHRRVRIERSSCVFVASGSDMQTLDAAVSARNSLSDAPHAVRAVLSDPDLAATLPETAPRGFLGAANVQGFSLPAEAARLLIAQARFDRVALEKRQKRVHLVIVGCGAQGESVAVETLLTAWRTGLEAPVISIFDRNAALVRSRLKRRAPALFPNDNEPSLPIAARARINIEAADADTIDFGADEGLKRVLSEHGPATAWVFAAGDDSLNLRAAAALHMAILKRTLPPAPIHVRIWSGHQGDTPVLSTHPIGIARAFGALEATMAATPACDDDPDQIARELHEAYRAQGIRMRLADPSFVFSDEPWDDLSETKRNANRRLHRHAVMKFEDLGGQWRHRGRMVPAVDAELRDPYVATENIMDYDVMQDGKLPRRWWKSGTVAQDIESTHRASRILAVAIAEHNRWTADRALDGWKMTPKPAPSQRNDERRLHDNMHGWSDLDAVTRRWDAVLLRTLVEGDSGRDVDVSAWTKRVCTLVLATRTEKLPKKSNIAVFEPRCRFVQDPAFSGETHSPTEIRIVIAGEPGRDSLDATIESARQAFSALMAKPAISARLCRVRFDFFSHPAEETLALANAIGAAARAWAAPPPKSGRPNVQVPVEISSLWDWQETPAPVFGFVGHRDLDRTNGPQGLALFLEVFFAGRLARGAIGGLVSGYAPGADRIAVDAWTGLGATKPLLFFPFSRVEKDSSGTDNLIHLTEEGAVEGAPEWVPHGDIAHVGVARTSQPRPGLDAHRSQASDILDNCDVLVAVYDGAGNSGSGSAGDTLLRARTMGKKVIIIDRDEEGNWRHDDPDEETSTDWQRT